MRLNKFMLRLLLVTVVFLGGCVTPPRPIPPELQYVAPTGQVGLVATLVGSQEKGTQNDSIAYVLAVDGKLVMTGTQGLSTPLPIQSGLRNITVAFQGEDSTHRSICNYRHLLATSIKSSFRRMCAFLEQTHIAISGSIDIATKKPVTGIGCGGIVNPPY